MKQDPHARIRLDCAVAVAVAVAAAVFGTVFLFDCSFVGEYFESMLLVVQSLLLRKKES